MIDKKTILVVDDEEKIQLAVKRVLEKEGHFVVLAGSVKECKEKLTKLIPDLILMDVVLQDGNGIELARELNQNENYLAIGILLMSGLKTDEIDRQLGIGAGALDFVTKPIEMNNLVQRINLIFSVQRLEKRRLDLEKQYEQLFTNVSDLVFVLDNRGFIKSLSKSFELITDHKINDWINSPIEDLFFEKEHSKWQTRLQQLNEGLIQDSFEINILKSAGNYIPLMMLLSKIRKNDNDEGGILGIAKDLSLNKFFEFTKSEIKEGEKGKLSREKTNWKVLSESGSSLTQNTYEVSAFSNKKTEFFKQFLDEYGKLFDKSIEARIYKIDHDNSGDRRDFANRLGFYKAGPRDLIRINSEFFSRIEINIHPKKLSLYHEEARIILLEIMGYMVSYYRNRNIN